MSRCLTGSSLHYLNIWCLTVSLSSGRNKVLHYDATEIYWSRDLTQANCKSLSSWLSNLRCTEIHNPPATQASASIGWRHNTLRALYVIVLKSKLILFTRTTRSWYLQNSYIYIYIYIVQGHAEGIIFLAYFGEGNSSIRTKTPIYKSCRGLLIGLEFTLQQCSPCIHFRLAPAYIIELVVHSFNFIGLYRHDRLLKSIIRVHIVSSILLC